LHDWKDSKSGFFLCTVNKSNGNRAGFSAQSTPWREGCTTKIKLQKVRRCATPFKKVLRELLQIGDQLFLLRGVLQEEAFPFVFNTLKVPGLEYE